MTQKNQPQLPEVRRPVTTVDYERYAPFLVDEVDMSEEQKLEFTQALWEIMLQLAIYGVRFDSEATGQTACGQASTEGKNSPSPHSNAIECSHRNIANEFETASSLKSASAVEEVRQ